MEDIENSTYVYTAAKMPQGDPDKIRRKRFDSKDTTSAFGCLNFVEWGGRCRTHERTAVARNPPQRHRQLL